MYQRANKSAPRYRGTISDSQGARLSWMKGSLHHPRDYYSCICTCIAVSLWYKTTCEKCMLFAVSEHADGYMWQCILPHGLAESWPE